jgi:hypothetical protein
MRKAAERVHRPPINSAIFNVREITKQMLLLEDHLTDDEKFCVDCIRKHFLMIEALSEEAVQMDSRSKWASIAMSMAKQVRLWQMAFIDGSNKANISQGIRKRRKELVEMVFDPRA